jgi:hypothetical protein
MQVGTEILLARMQEYPEEFFTEEGGLIGRWERIIRNARDYLPKEDVDALDEGYRQLRVDKFNEQVLARLAGEDKQPQPEETMTIKAQLYGGSTQQEYEQAMKQAQYDADMRRRAMQAQNSAMQGIGAQGMGAYGLGGAIEGAWR